MILSSSDEVGLLLEVSDAEICDKPTVLYPAGDLCQPKSGLRHTERYGKLLQGCELKVIDEDCCIMPRR